MTRAELDEPWRCPRVRSGLCEVREVTATKSDGSLVVYKICADPECPLSVRALAQEQNDE